MKNIFMWALIFSGFSSLAFSAEPISEKQYGAAGCGLGSQIIGKNGPQLVVATVNMTLLQSLAIGFGTSNCTDPVNPEDDAAAQNFFETNEGAITKEMALGRGEHLRTLAFLSGCYHDGFEKNIQSEYRKAPITTFFDFQKRVGGCYRSRFSGGTGFGLGRTPPGQMALRE